MTAMMLVTGGAGFIGSHLVGRLVACGQPVRVLDDFSTGKIENLAGVLGSVEVLTGDVRDPDAVRSAADGAQVLFHLAAIASVQRSIADPAETLAVNLGGTLNVLEAARAAGCRRVVFASSAAVYGDAAASPTTEAEPPLPLSPYAITKLTGEQLCAVYTRLHGLETVSLRFFNVFGPRQDPSSPYSGVISRFVSALLDGERPVVFGDGRQTRDFVYVTDVVDALLLAATAPQATGGAFNVATGRGVSVNDTLRVLATLTRARRPPRHEPARAGDIRHSVADIDAARRAFGYEATVSLADGLARTIEANHQGRGPRTEGRVPTRTSPEPVAIEAAPLNLAAWHSALGTRHSAPN
jgi:UDP-glucose 4-epimerase